tara:strand:+ start:106 stop:1554 length:1449 start_codon:yes stop_codon:yes gene_type:complete
MPSILGANTLSGGFEVANSLRFNDGDSPALTRSLGTTTLATKGTFSFWVKRGQLGTAQMIYTNEVADDNNRGQILFEDDDTFMIRDTVSGSNTTLYATTQKFRDVGAWYHMVVALDSTEAGGNRIRVYKNGTRIPDANFGTSTEPNQNSDFKLLTGGQTNKNHIGKVHGGSNHFDGYLAEFVYCDGQVLDASSFGEFDEDTPSIWKPISVSGLTMGDQGFYLDFEDSSALGNDKAGSNNFGTVTNLAATDQSTDTCTNNFAVLNAVAPTFNSVFSEGNLRWTTDTASKYYWINSTFGVSQGKWYMEAKLTTAADHNVIGIANADPIDNTSFLSGTGGEGDANIAYQYGYKNSDGQSYNNASGSSYGNTYAEGDIMGMYVDLDNNKIYWAKNGTVQNSGTGVSITDPGSVPGGVYFLAVADGTSSNASVWEVNFGGTNTYSISSGNSDPNGYGNFEYDPSAGTFDSASKSFYALNTKNLSEFG